MATKKAKDHTEQQAFPFRIFEEEMVAPVFGNELSEIERYIASMLLDAESETPVSMAQIIERVAELKNTTLSNRQVRVIIRSLRRDHAFPILSRRKAPSGYWWCRSSAEMKEFTVLWQSQYFDEMMTLHVMVKHNYPRLAGQMRLNDVSK